MFFFFFNYVLPHDGLSKIETILNIYPITVLLAHGVLRSACNDVVIRKKKTEFKHLSFNWINEILMNPVSCDGTINA